jgi:hypothetical protein
MGLALGAVCSAGVLREDIQRLRGLGRVVEARAELERGPLRVLVDRLSRAM